jgi:hypothetical protein
MFLITSPTPHYPYAFETWSEATIPLLTALSNLSHFLDHQSVDDLKLLRFFAVVALPDGLQLYSLPQLV